MSTWSAGRRDPARINFAFVKSAAESSINLPKPDSACSQFQIPQIPLQIPLATFFQIPQIPQIPFQIPLATFFARFRRFRRFRFRFRMPPFCQIPQIPLQIPHATFFVRFRRFRVPIPQTAGVQIQQRE